MATSVTIETDKQPPPQGSSRRNRMIAMIQAVVQSELGDSMITVDLVKRKGK